MPTRSDTDDFAPKDGDRMLIGCRGGGPSFTRLVYFPPPWEIEELHGVYVLVDDGAPAEWFYEWVPS